MILLSQVYYYKSSKEPAAAAEKGNLIFSSKRSTQISIQLARWCLSGTEVFCVKDFFGSVKLEL